MRLTHIIVGSLIITVCTIITVLLYQNIVCTPRNNTSASPYNYFCSDPSAQTAVPQPQTDSLSSDQTEKIMKDNFDENMITEEASDMGESKNPDWWLNSGAFFIQKNGIGMTVSGELATGSPWQEKYNAYNPESTDNGIHPQNIFRLINRERWQNAEQEVYFKIATINPSNSDFRNESNGVLLFHRYLDDNDLYYAGLRVDGAAVIKKKVKGEYFTLASAEIFTKTNQPYDRQKNVNLLPTNTWIGLRSTVINNINGNITLTLMIDKGDGNWITVLETTDTPWRFNNPPHTNSGFAGIRTDFMDVAFENYSIKELNI